MNFIIKFRRIIIPVTVFALSLLIFMVLPKDEAIENGDMQLSKSETSLSDAKQSADSSYVYDFVIDIEKPDIRGDKEDTTVTDTEGLASTEPVSSETEEPSSEAMTSDAFDVTTAADTEDAEPVKLYDVPLTAEKQLYAVQMAEEFDIPVELIFGVMYVESRYHETSVSRNGKCIGIMQIASGHLTKLNRLFGITDLHDYYQNVKAGAYYISYFYSMYGGDVNKALMCYHYGEGGARNQWKKGNTEDSYCRKVAGEIERITAAGMN